MKEIYLDYEGNRLTFPPASNFHSDTLKHTLLTKVPTINVIIKREGHFLSGIDKKGVLYWVSEAGYIYSSAIDNQPTTRMYKKFINRLPRNYNGL